MSEKVRSSRPECVRVFGATSKTNGYERYCEVDESRVVRKWDVEGGKTIVVMSNDEDFGPEYAGKVFRWVFFSPDGGVIAWHRGHYAATEDAACAKAERYLAEDAWLEQEEMNNRAMREKAE